MKLEDEVKVVSFAGDIDQDFSCGEPSLDAFYHKSLQRQWKAGVIAAHIVVVEGVGTVAFATMSATTIPKSKLGKFGKNLPYRDASFTLIGRFAVDKDFEGLGIGRFLIGRLADIAHQASERVGSLGVVVDALPSAVGFYTKLGFIECKAEEGCGESVSMFLPFPKRK